MGLRPLRPMAEVIRDWAPELAERLGLSVDEVREWKYLQTVFPRQHVEIRYPYGHVHRIVLAFAVVRPSAGLAAVFSEHAGYSEFELIDDCVNLVRAATRRFFGRGRSGLLDTRCRDLRQARQRVGGSHAKAPRVFHYARGRPPLCAR